MLVRFTDGSLAQVEVGWGHKAGLDVRVEVHATDGYLRTDATGETGLRAFAGRQAGYVVEKATADRGWIAPVPDEAIACGYHGTLDHLVQCFRRGQTPRQTLRDGSVDNAIIDAGYRAARSRQWEPVEIPDRAPADPPPP
jgi:predicted dehydrogenase